jgi:hypothetical protein
MEEDGLLVARIVYTLRTSADHVEGHCLGVAGLKPVHVLIDRGLEVSRTLNITVANAAEPKALLSNPYCAKVRSATVNNQKKLTLREAGR